MQERAGESGAEPISPRPTEPSGLKHARTGNGAPLGEVEQLLLDVELQVQGLFEDVRQLGEKLDFALRPSLLEKAEVGDPRLEALPSSRFGRRLLELLGQTRKLREELADIDARVAL